MKRREFLVATGAIVGTGVPLIGRAQTRPCPPGTVALEGGSSSATPCTSSTAEADWLLRSTAPGVVWAHDFRSDAEVNAFRWTSAWGNDPLAVGSERASRVRRITTDGLTGGGCLEIFRAAGTQETGTHWWRPFSPIVGSGNGRGIDDPGANGTIAAQLYSAVSKGGQIAGWGRRGYYGHQSYHTDGVFDGTEYYLQMRVKMDPRRIQGQNASHDGGKLLYLTRTDVSATSQEIVTMSGYQRGGRNMFNVYRSVSPALNSDAPGVSVHGHQPGTKYGTVSDGLCRFDDNGGRRVNCWHWPTTEQWVTVLYHVRPGTDSGNDTLFEVFVAEQGKTTYTQIWYQPNVDLPFGAGMPFGHNAMIASSYCNNLAMDTDFYHRYDQIIFSKSPIPCPQA